MSQLIAPKSGLPRARAFTFIELLVVLAVVAFLATIFLRALASTEGSTLRTQCLNNLRQLGIGSTVCANDNNGVLVPAKPTNNATTPPYEPPFVQYALFSYYTNELSAAGIPLVINPSNAPSVWCCPDVPDLPCPDTPNYPQWIIGYQYFGGFTEWSPGGNLGAIPGTHSPVKLSQAQPYWCLGADLVAKINGKWGGSEALITSPDIDASYKYWPPHRKGNRAYPQGGNEVFADCSAKWCNVETMYAFTTWTAANQLWFYQGLTDITIPSVLNDINALKWNPSTDP